MIYIPDGYTDRFQPLDIAVFAVLKNITNAKLSKFLTENPDIHVGMENSVRILRESWDIISTDTLQRAWDMYL